MNWKQGLLILVAGGSLVGLYFAPKVPKGGFAPAEEGGKHSSTGLSLPFYVDSIKTRLPSETRKKLSSFEADLDTDVSKYDSLMKVWDKAMMPVASAHYGMLKAEKTSNPDDWYVAGDRFLMAAQGVRDMGLRKTVYEKAIVCFENAQEIDPSNLNAKAGLGVTYVESAQLTGQPPMKGIGILKQVLAEDSTNTNALMNLGRFALQSGQLDLAIKRFEKVLEIDPNINEAFVYLAEICLKKDNKENAIQYLEQYRNTLEDERIISEVDRYIEEIRTKN